MKFNLPNYRANGILELEEGIEAHPSYHQSPCAGGLRFTPTVTQKEIESLSKLATIKNAWLHILQNKRKRENNKRHTVLELSLCSAPPLLQKYFLKNKNLLLRAQR